MSVSASPFSTVNTPTLSSARSQPSTFPWPLRRLGRLTAAIACASVLAACTTIVNAPTPLPALDEAATLRDQVARHEAATIQRATELQAKAATCADCQTAATSIIEGAKARLEAIGGIWEPWPADTPQSWVEQPAPIAEAPLDPQAFAQWLGASARHDMNAALERHRHAPQVVSTEQVVPILALGAGRALEAWTLASAYGVDLDTDALQLAALIDRASYLPSESPDDRAQWVLTATDSAPRLPDDQSTFDEALRKALTESTQASEAVRTWDCVAQTLPHLDIAVAPISNAEIYADVLLTRSTDLLAKGVTDTRQLRCEFDVTQASELARQVLAADMAMALSESPEVSSLGVELMLTDVHQWSGVISSADLLSVISR